MTKLSTINAESRRLAGRAPEAEQRAFQAALIDCCEKYWEAWRGPQPPQALAQTLWSVTPPLAELFVDMVHSGDARLADLLAGIKPARALAALVLAEIEHGNAEGAHITYEAMMLFESPQAGRVHAERVAAALRAPHTGPALRPPAAREPLWKALAEIVAHTARHDMAAVSAVIQLLALPPPRRRIRHSKHCAPRCRRWACGSRGSAKVEAMRALDLQRRRDRRPEQAQPPRHRRREAVRGDRGQGGRRRRDPGARRLRLLRRVPRRAVPGATRS